MGRGEGRGYLIQVSRLLFTGCFFSSSRRLDDDCSSSSVFDPPVSLPFLLCPSCLILLDGWPSYCRLQGQETPYRMRVELSTRVRQGALFITTPTEVMDEVLRHLPRHDRIVLCHVSKALRDISIPFVYKKIELLDPVSTYECCKTLISNPSAALAVRAFELHSG